MSKEVDKWLKEGRKNCKKGEHWYILHYPDYLLCPVCGDKKEVDDMMPEYNGYIVCTPKFEAVGV